MILLNVFAMNVAAHNAVSDSIPDHKILTIPDTIFLAEGVTSQLFYRSMIQSLNPYQWNLITRGDLSGHKYPRFFETEPEAGTYTTKWSLLDEQNRVKGEKTAVVKVRPIGADPSEKKRVLIVGNSLTANGRYTTELNRMLTGTGGSPRGLGYSNIEFIGTRGEEGSFHEGYGGKQYKWLMSDTASPFVFSSTFDPKQYMDHNGYEKVDYMYILLGWNNMILHKQTVADWSQLQQLMEDFLDEWLRIFPNLKINVMGLQPPSPFGGLGQSYLYEENQPNLANYLFLLQSRNSYNRMVESVANSEKYRDVVDYIDTGLFFDAENSYPFEEVPVNSRSTRTEVRQTNGLHPSPEGYNQIADAIFHHFVTRHLH